MSKKNLFLSLIFTCASLFAQDESSLKKLIELPVKREVTKNGDTYLQANFSEVFLYEKGLSKSNDAKNLQWINAINAPHPSVSTIKKYLNAASEEFNVPFPILDAIAKKYNNYTILGQSEFGSFGIMGLVQNNSVSTLKEAAELINKEPKIVQNDYRLQIRAAAALLSKYAKENKNSKNLVDWFNAVKEFSGLIYEDTKEMQAIDYYTVLNEGLSTITLWNEKATVVAQNNPEITMLINDYNQRIINNTVSSETNRDATSGTVDYPGAIASFTDCNFGSGRNGTDIDTWVNHYIEQGTVATTITYFRQCRPNAPTSAHFVVGLNGKAYQMVKVSDRAYHCGAAGAPLNNYRSIGAEHEVVKTAPESWNNETLLKGSTDLARYFCNKYGISKTRSLPGIRGHKEMPNSSTDCPYTLPWTRWMQLLNGATPVPAGNIPSLNTPAAGANVAAPVSLTWSSGVSGASYRIQVSKVNTGWTATNGFTTDTSSNANTPVNYSAEGLVSYTWPNADTAAANRPVVGTIYYWTVRSYSTATGISSYAPVKSFKVTSSSFAKQFNDLIIKEVVVYPNPTNDVLNIEINNPEVKNADIAIFDINGVRLFNTTYKGVNVLINTASFKEGYYFVKVTGDAINASDRIIINHSK